jgi:hypothetical protein
MPSGSAPSDGYVLVFLPANQFEIVSKGGCRETQNHKGENLHPAITREFLRDRVVQYKSFLGCN